MLNVSTKARLLCTCNINCVVELCLFTQLSYLHYYLYNYHFSMSPLCVGMKPTLRFNLYAFQSYTQPYTQSYTQSYTHSSHTQNLGTRKISFEQLYSEQRPSVGGEESSEVDGNGDGCQASKNCRSRGTDHHGAL